MRIHFNDDVNEDIVSILAFLDGLGFNEAQQRMAIDISKIRSILNGVRQVPAQSRRLQKNLQSPRHRYRIAS
jgi:hypothetical protein